MSVCVRNPDTWVRPIVVLAVPGRLGDVDVPACDDVRVRSSTSSASHAVRSREISISHDGNGKVRSENSEDTRRQATSIAENFLEIEGRTETSMGFERNLCE